MKCNLCGEDINIRKDYGEYSRKFTKYFLFKRRWIYTHVECEKKWKKESPEEIRRQSRLDGKKVNIRDLDNNILPCNLCGLSTCKNINSCMVTSD